MQINAVHQPHLDPFVGLLHNLFVVWPRAITGETAIWRLLMLAKYSANIKFKGRPTEFDSDLVELKETAVRQQSAQILFLRNCAPLYCYYHHSKFVGQGRKAPAPGKIIWRTIECNTICHRIRAHLQRTVGEMR